MISNGLLKVHDLLNRDNHTKKYTTYIKGSKYINFITAISGLINYIDGYKLTNYNQIIESDYREYIIDLNFEQYFKISYFDIDWVNSS